jgi:CubicO group peptidase (beta-lactamase class C family)
VKPEDAGVNSEKLISMINLINSSKKPINSIVIVHNGNIAGEYYFGSTKDTSKERIASCTKSIMSALIGIAINEGKIKGVDEKVISLFSKYKINNMDSRKSEMTLENLLTMTTGLEWNENNSSGQLNNTLNQMKSSAVKDCVQFVLDVQMRETPGTAFNYCSGASYLLSAIITNNCGRNTLSYARKKLFGPLGITNVSWIEDRGIYDGGSGLYMTTRDMAKFGYLYLMKGEWEGKQIVPESWVELSTKKHVETPPGTAGFYGYGYQWWMNKFGGYSARGAGGQFIYVLPEQDLVVAITSQLEDKDFFFVDRLMENFIIPAVNK